MYSPYDGVAPYLHAQYEEEEEDEDEDDCIVAACEYNVPAVRGER